MPKSKYVKGGDKLKRFLRAAARSSRAKQPTVEAGFLTPHVARLAGRLEFGDPRSNLPERPAFRIAKGDALKAGRAVIADALGKRTRGLCCKLGEGAMRDQGASCSPYDSALARRSCSHAMASVRAHGPRPKARSTIRASPTMPPWRANIPAWPLRSARITSKPLIVA